jgi:hypothetical protein
MPILFSAGATVFVMTYGRIGFHLAAICATVISILITILSAYLFERYIDALSIRISATVADIYIGKVKLDDVWMSSKVTAARQAFLLRSFAFNIFAKK